jgi:hypothetical protein
MKNHALYYSAILLPLILLGYALYSDHMTLFVWGILIYVLIYRPFTDGFRLISRGIIRKDELWKVFIPLYKLKWQWYCYFRDN